MWLEDSYHPYSNSQNSDERFCLTDGCGFISLNLALQMPSAVIQGSTAVSAIDAPTGIDVEKAKIKVDMTRNESQQYQTDCKQRPQQISKKSRSQHPYQGKEDLEQQEQQWFPRNDHPSDIQHIPSAYQVRIISAVGILKGILVVNRFLPDNTIGIRQSMHKVQPPTKYCRNLNNIYHDDITSSKYCGENENESKHGDMDQFKTGKDGPQEGRDIALQPCCDNEYCKIKLSSKTERCSASASTPGIDNGKSRGEAFSIIEESVDDATMREINFIMEEAEKSKNIRDIKNRTEGGFGFGLCSKEEAHSTFPHRVTSVLMDTAPREPLPLPSPLPPTLLHPFNSITIEIVNTAQPCSTSSPLRCLLNKHLILLLSHSGVPFYVFEDMIRFLPSFDSLPSFLYFFNFLLCMIAYKITCFFLDLKFI